MMKIYIGADHRGYKLKEEIQKYLEKKDYQVIDKGAFKLIPDDDYPDYAFSVAEAVTKNKGSKGILLCGSSNGVNVSANKVKGIFSSEVRSAEEAKEDIKHHNSDVLALSADNLNIDQMKEILDVWLTTEFEGGRHKRRLNKIWDYENKTHQQANCYVPTVKGLLIILLFILLLGLFASIDLVSPVFKNIDNKVDVTDLLQNDVEIQSSVEEIIIRSSCNNQLKTTGEKCYSDINYALGYANGDIRITIADAQYATSIIMRPYSAITNRLEPNSKECWKLKDPNNPSLGYHDLCDQGDRCGTTTTAPCSCATADSSLEGYDSVGKIKPGAICPRNVWANGIKDSVKSITISGRDNNKTLFPYPSSTANGFAIDIDGLKDVNISISDLTIRGVTVTNQRAAIAVGAANNNVKLELGNVSIDSIGGNGILIMGNNSLEAIDINMKNMLKSAIELSNTAKVFILNIELAANKDSAINVLDSSSLILNNAFVIDSGVAGIVFKGNSKGEIYDSVFKNNTNFNVGVIDNAEVLFRNSVVDGVNNRNNGFLIDNTAKLDMINALVLNTNKTLDVKSNQTRGNVDYNYFYRNTVRVISDDARFPIKNNILDRDPLVDSNYLLTAASPLINTGDPNVRDGDNSRSDIGLFGGPTQNLFVGNKYNTDAVNRIVLNEAGNNPTPRPTYVSSPTPTPYPNGCGYPSSFSSADFNNDRKVDITDFVCFIEEYRRRR